MYWKTLKFFEIPNENKFIFTNYIWEEVLEENSEIIKLEFFRFKNNLYQFKFEGYWIFKKDLSDFWELKNWDIKIFEENNWKKFFYNSEKNIFESNGKYQINLEKRDFYKNFENERKKLEIQKYFEKNKNLIYIFIVMIILSLIIIFFDLKNRKKEKLNF